MTFTDKEFHKVAPVPDTGRPSIYELRQPVKDWVAELFDGDAPLPRDGRVLDAGCGPGAYVPGASNRVATLVALDINPDRVAMVDGAQAARLAGDVESLPFADDSFDAVLAMHMLYHVPDIPRAVAELRRVLRTGGVLYAFTNSERAQWELTELYLRHGGDRAQSFGDERFSNESGGALLATAFESVELIEYVDVSRLVVTDPECVIDELERLRYTLEEGLRPGASWAALIEGARAEVAETVKREGAFVMSERHGLFVCR